MQHEDAASEFSIICDMALNNPDPDKRGRAVLVLGYDFHHIESVPTMLKQIAVNDSSSMVRRNSIASLVQYWRDDPLVFPLLQERLLSEPRNNNLDIVRLFIVKMFNYFKDHPDTFRILTNLALEDPNPLVRKKAISESAANWPGSEHLLVDYLKSDDTVIRAASVTALARHYHNNRENFDLIKYHALNDTNPDVRITTLEALTDYYHDNACAFEIVKDRAINDEALNVRKSAIVELARGWMVNNETLALLNKIANSDKNRDMRELAASELKRKL